MHLPTSSRSFALVTAFAVAIGLAGSLPAPAEAAHALVVTQASVAYTHYTSIQVAVNAAAPGDWIRCTPST